VIIYSTCTLAIQENEQMWKLLLNHGLEPIYLDIPSEWGWTDSSDLDHDLPKDAAFRMMPGQGGGEAFFICCFRKKCNDLSAEAGNSGKNSPRFTDYPVRRAIDPGDLSLPDDVQIVQLKNEHWLVGKGIMNEYDPRSWKKCIKPGFRMGGLNATGPIPVHESALLSDCNWETHPAIDLNEREALWYLSGREFDPGHMPDGYFLVRFKGLALGWSKRKGKSMARSYPAAWRIKMRA
jgi:NOL1/NOP2/fmu family ribosome biogenesis protein